MMRLAKRLLTHTVRVSLETQGLQRGPGNMLLNSAKEVSAVLKSTQRALVMQYRNAIRSGEVVPSVRDTGFRVFSQNDEDGLLLFVFAVIGSAYKTFVEIGTEDGTECNCANLAINFGWHGLFVDAREACVEAGRQYYASHPDTFTYPPKFVCARVTRENVNQVIQDAGMSGEIDLLSIDIDGNDYWIWEALTCISPRVVIIETTIEFGMRNIVVPYDAEYVVHGRVPDYHGASPAAMTKLAKRLGYRLVGANLYGFNTIYVRNDIEAKALPEVPVESVLVHPINRDLAPVFETIKDLPYVEV